jgi:hypothetical protein
LIGLSSFANLWMGGGFTFPRVGDALRSPTTATHGVFCVLVVAGVGVRFAAISLVLSLP